MALGLIDAHRYGPEERLRCHASTTAAGIRDPSVTICLTSAKWSGCSEPRPTQSRHPDWSTPRTPELAAPAARVDAADGFVGGKAYGVDGAIGAAKVVLDQLTWWAGTLRTARATHPYNS